MHDSNCNMCNILHRFFLSIRDISSYESIFIALESNKKNV